MRCLPALSPMCMPTDTRACMLLMQAPPPHPCTLKQRPAACSSVEAHPMHALTVPAPLSCPLPLSPTLCTTTASGTHRAPHSSAAACSGLACSAACQLLPIWAWRSQIALIWGLCEAPRLSMKHTRLRNGVLPAHFHPGAASNETQ